jgi:ribokinase
MDREQQIRQSAFLTDIVDTTAAGDTFTGYFVAGILSGVSFSEALKTASAAAAIAVSRKGAAPSIPWKDEVIKSLESMKENQSNYKRELIRRQIELYASEHIRDGSLEALAKLLNFSVIYTGSLVKTFTGESFSSLLQSKRCEIAAQMLLQTDLSVGEIIHCVGYENESFFRGIFKKKYGTTPLNYRKTRNILQRC